MIVTIVRFALSDPLSAEAAREHFAAGAPDYLDVEGLLLKTYLRSEAGDVVGGVYWWRDRAAAEAKFNDDWRAGVTAKYGAEPAVVFYEAPVVVDPTQKVIRTQAPPSGASLGPYDGGDLLG